jgi:uncharacterized protein (DUF2236 family)
MATSVSSKIAPDVPAEVRDAMSGLALTAAGANVVMQLAQLPVGHGVARSTVESGRIDRHPLKRTRTTLAYLMVALLGTEEQRAYMRREVDRQHRHVRSGPDDPVAYDAFDRDLQLWVAACLFRGVEDVHRLLYGEPDERTAEVIYRHAARLGTTLQVREDQWPPDREAFQEYWDREVAEIEMDDLTREYLLGVAEARFFGAPLTWVATPVTRFLTGGFLPPEFREELGLGWDARKQLRFERVMGAVASVNRVLPRAVREFPLNLYWWDTRRRMAAGKAIV